jgi:hypothetical protein
MSQRSFLKRNRSLLRLALAAGMAVMFAGTADAQARLSYTKGQNVSPAYEGWVQHPDGSKSFLFGYMNRNWDETPNVPAGPENGFSPGAADQGQPTHFMPRRNRFVFMVPVPAGFQESDELVWTLTTNGVTEKAYASLKPDYLVDNVVIASETGSLGAGTSSPETRSNVAPKIVLEGSSTLSARVGQPLTLTAVVTDDGIPRRRGAGAGASTGAAAPTGEAPQTAEEILRPLLRPPGRITVGKTNGLHFGWFVYRGAGEVEFNPPQVKQWEDTRTGANSPWAPLWTPPVQRADGKWITQVTFSEPGSYVLQGRADDGGLYSDIQVTVNVTR